METTYKPAPCRHPKICPPFDEVAAKSMTTQQIRLAYPRAHGKCPDCGWEGTMYASYAHYIMGDW